MFLLFSVLVENVEEDERCSWHIKIVEHLRSKAGTVGSACSHPEIHHVLAKELKDLMSLEEYCTVEPLLSGQGSALWPLNRGGR